MNLAPVKEEYEKFSIKFVGVYSKNREEYAVLDLSSAIFGYVTVPLYDTLGTEAISYILNQTNLETLFLSEECLSNLMNIENSLG
jgi:long-chain acyl-CoA synthetase